MPWERLAGVIAEEPAQGSVSTGGARSLTLAIGGQPSGRPNGKFKVQVIGAVLETAPTVAGR